MTSINMRVAEHFKKTLTAYRVAGSRSSGDSNDHELANTMEALQYQVFLSDPDSAVPGGVYFCGLKPYGRNGRNYAPPKPMPAGFTTYRDAPGRGHFYPRARKVIRQALDLSLGSDAPLESALCTNWFFFRAEDTKQLKKFDLKKIDCAAYHRDLLDKLKPKIILCSGNGPISSYAGFLKLFGIETLREERYIGKSYLRESVTQLANANYETRIIGLPHLSNWAVKEQALSFIGM